MREDENKYSRTEEKCSDLLFYFTISKQKDSDDTSVYDMQQIVDAFSKLLLFTTAKDLANRKISQVLKRLYGLIHNEDLKNGIFNIIFKSAKYNHVRNEINTETMTELGTRKRQQEGYKRRFYAICRSQ